MNWSQEPLSPIFRRVVEECKESYPDVHWEIQEKDISRHSRVYKLVGDLHGVRTFEAINQMMDDAFILDIARAHAKTIVDRIERVRHK